MIVIVIMGVVYTLAISNFSRLNDKSKELSLANLKKYLTSLDYEQKAELICFDDCSKCTVYLDGNKTKTEIEGFVDAEVRRYRYDSAYGFVEKENGVFFNPEGIEENVCFSYKVDSNKIGDQVLIEEKGKFYDMSTYLQETPVYDSMQDAQEAKENLANKVLR
jgi:hypothetical protein